MSMPASETRRVARKVMICDAIHLGHCAAMSMSDSFRVSRPGKVERVKC